MKNVIVLHGKVENIARFKLKKRIFDGITFFHDFEFTQYGMKTWKHSNIGTGRKVVFDNKIIMKEIQHIRKMEYVCQMACKDGSFTPVDRNFPAASCLPENCVPIALRENQKIVEEKSRSQVEQDLVGAPDTKTIHQPTQNGMFVCPHDACEADYYTLRELENHIQNGACKERLRQESQYNWMRKKYFNHYSAMGQTTVGSNPNDRYFMTHLKALKPIVVPPDITFVENSCFKQSYQIGYALPKSNRGQVTFTPAQKKFASDIFQHGQATNQKLNHELACQRMREARNDDGSRKFKPRECLTPLQMRGLFSSWMAQLKASERNNAGLDPRELEVEAAEDIETEITLQNIENIRNEVNSEQDWMKSHPLEVDTVTLFSAITFLFAFRSKD